METKLPLMSARFIVTGMKFSPHICTKYFEVEPTIALTKGAINPMGKRPVLLSSWSVETKWARYDSTDVPLQLLIGVIWPKRKRIRDFVAKKRLKIQFLLNINGAGERNFLYELSPRTVGQIGYFRSPIHLDVY